MSPPPAFADAAETWNRRYAGEGFLFGTEPNAWLREHAQALPPPGPGCRVLSIADGEGRNSVWLAKRGYRVDAFDISPTAVDKARAYAAREGVEVDFQVAGIDGLAWPAALYDAVVAIFIQFADPAQRATLFAGIERCLKPGGVLVLQGYTPRQLEYRTGGPPFASHLYTEAMLREAFAAMEITELREYEAHVAEGTGHLGHSALVGLAAVKR